MRQSVGVIIYKLMGDSIITGSMAEVSGKNLRLSSHLEYSELVGLIAQELNIPVQFFFGHKQVETNLTTKLLLLPLYSSVEIRSVRFLELRNNASVSQIPYAFKIIPTNLEQWLHSSPNIYK